MNAWLRLIVLGILLGVTLCEEYDGRRPPRPRPLPLPKPLPKPVPIPHPKPPSRCHGSCGGFAGTQCPRGYRCKYFPSSDYGECCPIQIIEPPQPNPCKFGQDGICGGIFPQVCRPGTTCTSIGMEKVPDGHGVCCINGPIIKPPTMGVCPPPSMPSRRVTRCGSRTRRCVTDKDCPRGFKCCTGSDWCGRVCKRPLPLFG